MQTFYKTKNENLVTIVDDKEAVFFNNECLLTQTDDIEFVKSNMPQLIDDDEVKAQEVYDKVKDFNLVQEEEWLQFFINKKDFKIYVKIWENKIELEKAELKNDIIKEKAKLKDFLKWIKKSKDNYMFGDRVLLYWPTWTWKTYGFLEFLKVAKIEHMVIWVTEGMEDIDLFNRIVPWATWVSYKTKEIVKLLEKAEKWDKVCLIFDELNRWSNSLMNLVLKALDPVDWKNYHITDVIQDRTYVIPQENIIWWATVNLGWKYTWTNALDEALLDRFNIVKYKWYDKKVEKAIIKSSWIDNDKVKKIEDFVEEVRGFHNDWEIRAPISTRWLKVWIEDFVNTWNLFESFEKTLLYRLVTVDDYWIPNEEELGIIKSKLEKLND